MNGPHFWLNPAFWAYLLVVMPFLVFVLAYGLGPLTRKTWYRTPAGRGLMILSGALTAVVLNVLVALVMGPGWVGRDFVRWFVVLLVAPAGWYQLHTLFRVQREVHRAGRETPRRDVDSDGLGFTMNTQSTGAKADRRRLRALRRTELDK